MILYFILLDKQTKRIIEFCELFVFELEIQSIKICTLQFTKMKETMLSKKIERQ